MPESSDRGALTEAVFYILLSLHEPKHGYALMQQIAEMTGDRVMLGAGTLYGALNTLIKKGWIEDYEDDSNDRRKAYLITEMGREIFAAEIVRLKELLKNAEKIYGGK